MTGTIPTARRIPLADTQRSCSPSYGVCFGALMHMSLLHQVRCLAHSWLQAPELGYRTQLEAGEVEGPAQPDHWRAEPIITPPPFILLFSAHVHCSLGACPPCGLGFRVRYFLALPVKEA